MFSAGRVVHAGPAVAVGVQTDWLPRVYMPGGGVDGIPQRGAGQAAQPRRENTDDNGTVSPGCQ